MYVQVSHICDTDSVFWDVHEPAQEAEDGDGQMGGQGACQVRKRPIPNLFQPRLETNGSSIWPKPE
jgi:hypothetical protein